MIRLVALLLSYDVAGLKGWWFLRDPIDPNGEDVSAEAWGLRSAGMARPWSRLRDWRVNGEPLTHVATNYAVEYFENTGKTGLRRAVKMSAAWSQARLILGLIAGMIAGAILF